jgi:hypothetical protein
MPLPFQFGVPAPGAELAGHKSKSVYVPSPAAGVFDCPTAGRGCSMLESGYAVGLTSKVFNSLTIAILSSSTSSLIGSRRSSSSPRRSTI